MSDRSRMLRRSLALLMVAAAAAAGQSEAALERGIDSALARVRLIDAQLKAISNAEIATRYPDTVKAGTVTLLTVPEFAALTREAGPKVEAALRARDSSLLAVSGPMVITVRGWLDRFASGNLLTAVRIGDRERYERFVDPTADSLAHAIVSQVEQQLVTGPKGAAKPWLAGGTPSDTVLRSEWIATRVELVTSASHVGHACLDGKLEACASLLRANGERTLPETMYDPDGRRTLVAKGFFWEARGRADRDRCLGGADSVCIRILESDPHWMGRDLPGAIMRRTLMATAIRMGGQDAVSRLVLAPADAPGSLAAAARVPFDSVIAVWHARVNGSGNVSSAFSLEIAAIALGWVGIIVLLLTRSSRWR